MNTVYEYTLKILGAVASYAAAFWGLMTTIPIIAILSVFTLVCRAIIDGERAYQLYKRWKHGRKK